MAFFRNSAVNLINLHYGIVSLAMSGGGVFYLVFLLRAGLSVPATFLTMAAILVGRFMARPLVLLLAIRFGLKPVVIAGTMACSLQYLVLAQVHGIGTALWTLIVVASVSDTLYWSSYHAYFAKLGDAEHRGHQVSAREALASLVGIVAPLMAGAALVTLGPLFAFGATAVVQLLAAGPLFAVPNVAIARHVPGGFRASRSGFLIFAADGWVAASNYFAWQMALFLVLGSSYTAYGGAMALAALVGAASGLLLGRYIDQGNGRRAVIIAYGVVAGVTLLRAFSLGSPSLAVFANALGALSACLQLPAMMTVVYNHAKLAPCPLRFQIAAEGGWDVGCLAGCLAGAAITASGAPLSIPIGLGLLGLCASVLMLRHYYAQVPVIDAPELARHAEQGG